MFFFVSLFNIIGIVPYSHELYGSIIQNFSLMHPKFKAEVITMNKGDVLFFRADLIHAGWSYAEENLRIHFHIDFRRNGYHRETNKTDKCSPMLQNKFNADVVM